MFAASKSGAVTAAPSDPYYEYENMTEEQIVEAQNIIDGSAVFQLEEEGWIQSECEMIMDCEPEITLVSETDE